MLTIKKTDLKLVIEPLKAPFGFKGGYARELWQVVARVESDTNFGIGLGVQSTLWSDASVYAANSYCAGNSFMLLITEYALDLLKGRSFKNPIEALDFIREDVYEYAKKITGNPRLRKTFALNALVAVDNALWQLMGKECDSEDFCEVVGEEYKDVLSNRVDKICNIPLITYKMTLDDVRALVDEGFFFLKIKIGADPDGDGSFEKMLAWDKQRLLDIHNLVKDIRTPYTENGYIPYYLDANGRYDTKERFQDFLDFAKSIGALERLAIIEEPFDEENKIDVSDLNVRIAADESAHSCEDVVERINLGYSAIALKPIAKTMSESLKILKEAQKRNVPCFCADLTVNPVMVEFNKNVAARMSLFPGIKIGVMESNGHQNYVNWEDMQSYHPLYNKADYIQPRNGIFHMNDEFYAISGGIFRDSEFYCNLF